MHLSCLRVIKRTECLLFTYKTLWNLQLTLYAFENQLWTEVHIIICWKWIVMGSHPATQTAQFLPILLCPLGSMCSLEFGWLNHFFAISAFLDKLYKWYWFMPGMLEEIKSGYYKYWSQWQWHANSNPRGLQQKCFSTGRQWLSQTHNKLYNRGVNTCSDHINHALLSFLPIFVNPRKHPVLKYIWQNT